MASAEFQLPERLVSLYDARFKQENTTVSLMGLRYGPFPHSSYERGRFDILSSATVNLIPLTTKDLMEQFDIKDPSLKHLSPLNARCFRQHAEDLPRIHGTGDVVLLRNMKASKR